MSARTSFGLCVLISALPLIPATLGFYHFVLVRTSNSAHPAIADLCIMAYQRSIDLAGHISLSIVALVLAFLFVRLLVVLIRGWQETRRIRSLRTIDATSAEFARIRQLPLDARSKEAVRIIDADEPFAVTVGYFVPQIMLSASLVRILDDAELEAVLRHEATHVARRDPLKLLISDVCRSALPFVPLIAYIARDFRVSKELEADARTVAAMGSSAPLASALAKVLTAMPFQHPAGAGLTPTEARIDALLGREPLHVSARPLVNSALLSAPALAGLSLVLYLIASSPHLTPMHICSV